MPHSENRRNRRRRYREFMKQTGRPVTLRDGEQERARQRVRSFHARGMTYLQMAEQIGANRSTLTWIAHRETAFITRDLYDRIASLRFEEPAPTRRIPNTGTLRRIGAMWRDGFGLPWIAEQSGVGTRNYLQMLLREKRGYSGITYATAKAVRELYEDTLGKSPEDVGIPSRGAALARTCARKKGYAPRKCWDEDTIDDPEAIPDWTGYCGTGLGMAVHRRDGIPPCEPCKKAFTRGVPYPGFNGERLKELRLRAGYARVPLAKLAHLHESSIQYWETGRSIPQRMGGLDRVLSVLDATYDDVCDQGEEA